MKGTLVSCVIYLDPSILYLEHQIYILFHLFVFVRWELISLNDEFCSLVILFTFFYEKDYNLNNLFSIIITIELYIYIYIYYLNIINLYIWFLCFIYFQTLNPILLCPHREEKTNYSSQKFPKQLYLNHDQTKKEWKTRFVAWVPKSRKEI